MGTRTIAVDEPAHESELLARPEVELRAGAALRLICTRRSGWSWTKYWCCQRSGPDFLKSCAFSARTQLAYWLCRKYIGSTWAASLSGFLTTISVPVSSQLISGCPPLTIAHVLLIKFCSRFIESDAEAGIADGRTRAQLRVCWKEMCRKGQ